jgi:nondiscriminating glutamyl-tRNA synthetase
VDRLSQIPEKAKIFFQETAAPANEAAAAILKSPEAGRIGSAFLTKTSSQSSWNAEAFLAVMKEIQKETGVKGRNLWMPIRVMLTGQEHGPELPKIVEIFGLEKCRRLVRDGLPQSSSRA